MDEKLALEAFATILKPGGTLAIWFYGHPHFSEPDTCQSLFDQIMECTLHEVINTGGPERMANWKSAGSGNGSWLDDLDFSTGPWERVQRMKWNSKTADLGWFTQRACEFKVDTLKSKVTEADELIEKEDPEMWGRSWDIEEVKEFFNFCFPNIQE
jgi:SAM-dependent methyltransferase